MLFLGFLAVLDLLVKWDSNVISVGPHELFLTPESLHGEDLALALGASHVRVDSYHLRLVLVLRLDQDWLVLSSDFLHVGFLLLLFL
tara:strand:+ start:148 stop:408 length:261 start_codon:yes stop_codon:yes gene_type:complete